MSFYDEYQIVINEAQRRLIMRALTNAMANDRRSTKGGSLTRPTSDEWMQLIRLFGTIEPSRRKRPRW
jgi:monoamine oxidase